MKWRRDSTAMDPPIQIPVGFYVIKHPKGNILFDTGNNDKLITDHSWWPMYDSLKPAMTPEVAIDVQLKRIGLTPDDIKYVVVSDLDLFGDGSVVVKRWVAHTPGSQMMTVKLKNTGLIILTGDNVYFAENLEKNIAPNPVTPRNTAAAHDIAGKPAQGRLLVV
jgi:glyoxylase-like metal-dependent hydrolase (beta-lactamase superfamily II)